MERLGRINLLVGTNNCGKTSVLEAIHILFDRGSPMALWGSLSRRGETRDDLQDDREVDVAHLFHGHELRAGVDFAIRGESPEGTVQLEAKLSERDPSEPPLRRRRAAHRLTEDDDDSLFLSSLTLSLAWSRKHTAPKKVLIPITRNGGFSLDYIDPPRVRSDAPRAEIITTEGLLRERVVSMLEDVVLNPEEETVLAALRTIEPGIERIVPIGTAPRRYLRSTRGGVAVKLAGQRVPIGSLGDGIWRILGISLALVEARGGLLLIDEIDTGLHYTVLEKMWHLVHETARRLDVQVFATTHSRDCLESLAAIAGADGDGVTIQRIERNRRLTVSIPGTEILEVANRGIEVR